MQPFAQPTHIRFGIGRLALSPVVRGGVLCGRAFRYEFGIDACELRLRLRAAGEGGLERQTLTLHAGAHRGQGGCGGFRRPAQRGDAHVVLGDERALSGDVHIERVEFGASADDVAGGFGRGILRIAQPGRDFVDLSAHVVDHALRDRRDLNALVVRVLAEQRESLTCQREQAAQPLLHPLESVCDSARLIDALGSLLLFELRDAGAEVLGLILEHQSFGVALLLAAGVAGQFRSEAGEFIREQSRARIPHDGGDRRRLAGDLGLSAQRLELAAQLAREVAQARQIRLHGFELAEGLLFPTTVLENARRFLDEAAALFGSCLQDAVEPALTDDHVHLATQARVAQQLLHVQQPADAAVDRVLARTVAEESAADRHFGVLDGQSSVGVVDRELHLGAPERSASRGAGEDDVFHFAAAERLGALLAHHPGEGVDHVRLARAVGAHDARHPGLERECRGLRERLEPFERHALQVHADAFHAGRFTALRYPRTRPHPRRRAGFRALGRQVQSAATRP